MAGTLDGQLWYIGNGGTTDVVTAHLNTDGSNITSQGVQAADHQSQTVAFDLAAGFYFTITGLKLESRSIFDPSTIIDSVQIGNDLNTPSTGDDDVVNAVAIDPFTHTLYVGNWGQDLQHTGIVVVNYSTANGTLDHNAAYGTNGVYDANTTYLITSASTGSKITDVRDFSIDTTNHKLYWTDDDNQYSLAPFNPTNNISVVTYNAANPSTTVTQLSSNANVSGGFPTNQSNGIIGPLAVDVAKGLIYFETNHVGNSTGTLWYMPITGGTATQVTLPAGSAIGFGDIPQGGISIDPQSQYIFITVQKGSAFAGPDQILQGQLSADGHSITSWVNTYPIATLDGHTPDPNAHIADTWFDQLPTLASLTASGTHAVEQGANVTLLSATPSITDTDGNHLASATVKISAGTFSSNENSTADDHLTIASAHRGSVADTDTSGTVAGTSISYSYNSATETLTLSGYDTEADYQTALTYVQYFTTGDNPTNYGNNTTRTLQWTASDGAQNVPFGAQNSGSTTLNIDAVNDAPVNHTPAGTTGNEDQQFAITGLSITDVDADPASASQKIIVAITVTHGTLNVLTNVANGVTAAEVVGNNTATVTLTATQNEINNTLSNSGLRYLGNQDYNGSDTVTVTTNDQGHTGSGGAQQVSNQFSITINAVNDPVTASVPATETLNEDSSVAVTGMSIADVDTVLAPNGVYNVTLSSSHGTQTLTTLTGLTFTAGDGTADATMTFHGKLSDINTALATASYAPNANYNGSDTVVLFVTDTFGGVVATGSGPATSDTKNVSVTVNAVNDPVTASAPASASVAEDASLALNAANTLSISDVDATLAPNGVYEVTLSVSHGTLTMTTLTGLTFTAGDGTADATMTFHGTLSNINTDLATASYSPTANYNGSDTIAFSVTDTFNGVVATGSGPATNDSKNVSVTVTAVNDPVTASAPASETVNEDASVAVTGMSISDVDATLAPNGIYSVTLSDTHGALTLGATTGLTFDSGNNATASMTFHGTLSDINTALATASYAPNANYNGADTIVFSVTDTFNNIVATGTGAATSDSKNIGVTINAVNDPVTATAPATVSVNEDASFALNGANTLSISDVDATLAPNGIYSVTLSDSHGTLTLGNTSGLTFDNGTLNGTGTLTFHGTLSNINTDLATASYAPTANYNGADTIAFSVTDLFNGTTATGSGAATSDNKNIGVTVNAVNDPVSASAPASVTTNEDTSFALNGGNTLSISDVDATLAPNGVYEVTLSATNGSLTLTTLTGLTFTAGDGTADASMTFHGTLSDINTDLATASYLPNADYNGADTIAFSVTDQSGANPVATGSGAATNDSKNVSVTITAVDDAPVNHVPGAQTVQPNVDLTFTGATAITVTDVDVDETASPNNTEQVNLTAAATATLTLATTANLTVSGDGTNNVTLTGKIVDIDAALDGLKYKNTASGVDTLTITTSDLGHTGSGGPLQDVDTISITVGNQITLDLDANDSSGATGNDYAAFFTGSAVAIADTDDSITDSGSATLTTATITITNPGAGDTLTVNGSLPAGITPTGSGTTQIVLSGSDTLANYQTALQQIEFNTTTTGTDDRDVTVVLNDGSNNSNTAHTTVFIHTLDLDSGTNGTGFSTTFTEDAGAVAIANTGPSGVVITEPTGQITSATITLTNHQASDVLSAGSLPAGITASAYNSGTGVLTLTTTSGTPTAADYDAAIQAITFNNTSDAPNTSDRDITVVVTTDQPANTNTAHATIHVTAVNDAPVLDPSQTPVLNAENEDAGAPSGAVGTLVSSLVDFSGPLSNVTDPDDASAVTGIALTATDTSHGTWFFSTDNGASWNPVGSVSPSSALLLAADANTRLYFQPNADFNGTVSPSITFEAWDQTSGTNGTSGVDASNNGGTTAFSTASDTADLTINSVNDAPSAQASGPVSTNEDVAKTFAASDFQFSDTHDTPSDNLAAVIITSLPSHGTLKLGVNPVNVNDTILAGQIGNLTYTPAGDYNGSDSFDFKVQDSGGTGNGGQDTSAAAATMSIAIDAVNDPVTASAPANASVNEDATTAVTGLAIADVDATLAPSGLYEVTLSDSNGVLTLGNTTGLTFDAGANGTALLMFHGTLADINTDLATASYAPNPNYNGADTITLFVSDDVNGTTATGSGPATSDSKNVAVTVNAVNDPVTASAPASVTTDEDVSFQLNGPNTLSISDVDDTLAPNGVYEVTLSASHGTLTLGNISNLTFTAGTGTSDATMTFHGKLSDINTDLATASYQGNLNYNGPDTIAFSATDLFAGVVATGSGAPTSDSKNIGVTINPVNDPPVANPDTGSAGENQTKLFDVVANDTDVDTGDTKTLDGSFTVDPVTSANPLVNGINASAAFSVVTNEIQFSPNTLFDPLGEGQTASVVVHYTMHDSANAPSNSTTFTLTVNGVNDAPVLANVAPNAVYAPNSPAVDLSPGTLIPALSITDIDNTMISGATVVITNGSFLGDQLAADGQTNGADPIFNNINVVYNPGNFTLTLTGSETLAHYAQVLQDVTFKSTNGNATNGGLNSTRTLDWQVNDGSALNNLSNIAHSTINLHVLDLDGNDSTATGTSFAGTFTEHGPAVAIADTDVVINDVDTGTMNSATVTLTNAKVGDSLAAPGAAGFGLSSFVDTSVPGQITLTLSGAASTANYQTVLHDVVFSNSSSNPDASLRDLSVVVTDSLNQATNPAQSTISMVLVNDPPVVNPNGGSLFYAGNQAPSPVDSVLTVSDVDSISLVGATVAITGNFHSGEDVLGFTNQNGITGNYNSGTGVLTLTGSATLANYQAALESVTFFDNNSIPTAQTRTVSWQVDDGAAQNHLSTIQTSQISVAAVTISGLNGGNAVEHSPVSATINDSGTIINSATYTWKSNGTTVQSSSSNTYTPGENDEGKALTLDVAFTDPNNASVTDHASQSAGTVQEDPNENASIVFPGLVNGHPQEGKPLTAVVTEGDAPGSGISYTWKVDGNVVQTGVDGAGNTYKPTQADDGKTITVAVTFTDTHGFAEHGAATAGVVSALVHVGAGDFDTDGDKNGDLLWQNSDGTVVTWDMNGAQIESQAQLGQLPLNWHFAGTGMFNPGLGATNGNTDAFFQSDAGQVLLWNMVNNHVTVDQVIGQVPSNWHIFGIGDVNGDGKSDVLFNSDAGAILEWQINGTSVAVDQVIGQSPAGGHAVAVADFNGDGKADILFQTDSGNIVMWELNGTQIIANQTVGQIPSNWHFATTGDFNGDGKADVLFRSDAGQVLAWEMNGTQVIANQLVGQMPTNWSVSGTADANGDGKSDIILTSDAGAHQLWEMNGTNVILDQPIGPGSPPASPPQHASAASAASFASDTFSADSFAAMGGTSSHASEPIDVGGWHSAPDSAAGLGAVGLGAVAVAAAGAAGLGGAGASVPTVGTPDAHIGGFLGTAALSSLIHDQHFLV